MRQTLLQAAERILVEEDAPIVPLYFYVSIEYYDTNAVTGIHQNIRVEHPLRAIGRLASGGRPAHR
jgi:ABC-type oligopeptide transport system substrate-binding subunit